MSGRDDAVVHEGADPHRHDDHDHDHGDVEKSNFDSWPSGVRAPLCPDRKIGR
jgi:hypothetical protein